MTGVKPVFDRWQLGWGETWAYKIFKQHHHQLNSFYWSHVGVERQAYAATKPYQRSDHASVLFTLDEPYNFHLDKTLGEWSDLYNEFGNWVRLSALVAVTGYLEVYLKTVTRAAIESDPGVLHGAPGAVDGVVYLKAQSDYSQKDQADKVAIGDWNSRIAVYTSLFGRAPAVLVDSISKLEKLRRTRNGVTHTFGRASDDYAAIAEAEIRPLQRVSQTRLVNTFRLIQRIAKAVEKHLGPSHVGAYEAMYFYHVWDKDCKAYNYREAAALSHRVGRLLSRSLGIDYFNDLIAYYKSV